MRLPKFLLGTRAEVVRGTRKFLDTVAAKTEPELPMVDTAEGSSFVVLDDSRLHLDGRNFHMYAPFMVTTTTRRELSPPLFERLVRTPWGPLSLMGQGAAIVRMHKLVPEPSWAELLRATIRWWPEYAALGPRFAIGQNQGELWSFPSLLKRELVERGVPREELRGPLPDDSLEAFLRTHQDKFADVLPRAPRTGA